ncbi:hypothetical protein D7Z54_12690 [Salibacterium salarium]|uniref:Uncharacterized protein n=1 Tax=Salibacterium salarium TaxID=284579 RepID=A0A3R9QLA2_9BACI|nr:hypothetical protein [Salibacterium salarium]RSL32878.1 hypothetical protein D7Z54_12690 [Salibacterium salarium]
MIVSMYLRRMKIANRITIVIFLIGISMLLIDWPDSSDDWFNLILICIVGLFMASIAYSSHKKYVDVKNSHIPESARSVTELNHLVLKKEVALFPRLLLFEKNGHFIGFVKPLQIPFLFYPISLLLRDSLIMILPISFAVFNSNNHVLFSFRRKGVKQSTVTIRNRSGERIGEYVQDHFKKLMNIQGRLKNAQGDVILPVETEGLAGDFTLTDNQGRQWAHFYDGYFPHEYTHLFRDTDNDIVDLTDDLNETNKMLLIAMISFMFLERSR